MSADDAWANWQPVQDAKAQGGSAFKARVALSSRGGSVSPDRRRPSQAAAPARNVFNNNRDSARGDKSAISRMPGPSAAKPADVVALRNFSRGEQPRSPFNMRNGSMNSARDAPPPPSNVRPPPAANPDRRAARPRSPDLDRDRDIARRAEPVDERARNDERRARTPPKHAREPEREDRSSRTGKRDDRLRERSRSRDRSDRRDARDKDKAKEQDRDGDSRRSKDDNSRRDRERNREGDRRDSGRSDTRKKDDIYRRSDRDTERKPREDASPRERPSRRDDDREDRRSSLKRARTPDRADANVKAELRLVDTRENGRDGRRRDRREDERNDRSDHRDRRQDRKEAPEPDVRHSKRLKEDTPPPKSAKSDLSQASLPEPIVPEDAEMRSNTPPPRVVEQIPEPVKPEVAPVIEDIPAVQEVVETPSMDEPYLAEGQTQDSLKKKPKILIRNLAPGTSHSDIQYFCDDFGVVLAVSSTADPENAENRIFEVAFNAMREAESAVSSIDNMQADGQILRANIVRGGGLRIKGADQTNKAPSTANTPTTAVPAQSPSAASLLSRLGGPALPASTPTTANAKKAKAQANGSLPADLLSPYTELLEKAGVRSLPALKKLLRPGSIPAYVERLAEQYPNEELLSGFTAKWALRERLEEWLGEKKESRIDWQERDRS